MIADTVIKVSGRTHPLRTHADVNVIHTKTLKNNFFEFGVLRAELETEEHLECNISLTRDQAQELTDWLQSLGFRPN